MDFTKVKCTVCGRVFSGETAQLAAEECAAKHEKIIISLWDYELSNFLNYFKVHDRNFLPKGFLKKLRKLQGRALRG